MRLLFDLSVSRVAKVSLFDGDKLIETIEGSSALELTDKLLKSHVLKLEDLTDIDSVRGPGSFTGLKIGAAIANALNYSLGKNKTITPTYEAKNG